MTCDNEGDRLMSLFLRTNSATACLLALMCLPFSTAKADVGLALYGFWPPDAARDAIGDLVFTGGSRPLRLRLIVQRDGNSLPMLHEQLRQAYFVGLLNQLDSDGDGLLNKTEASRLPPPPPPLSVLMRQRADEIFVAAGSGGADKNDDEMIDVEELRNFFDTHEDSLVQVTSVDAQTGGDPLFTRLDEDRNRRVSQEEWAAISNLLQFDRNGNGVLTQEELARPAASLAQEFVAAPSGSANSNVALVCRFETPSERPPDVLVLIQQSTTNGELSHTKIGFITSERSPIEVQQSSHTGQDGVVQTSFRFEGRLVLLQILPQAIRGVEQTQETLLREFAASDLDEDGLVPNSTEVPEFLQETFGLLDHDGSGEVSVDEVQTYLQGLLLTRSQLESTKMSVAIHQETRGLFSLIDRNGDGRLSYRECSTLLTDWSSLAGRAEEMRSSDIPRSTQIVLRPGSLASPYNSTGPTDLGPPWFYRMDRNRDGDLDLSEFLGGSELFGEIDANGDTLVSAGEAIAADRAFRPAGVTE